MSIPITPHLLNSVSTRLAELYTVSAKPTQLAAPVFRIGKTCHDFGASPSSKRTLESCDEQYHLRESIGGIAKQQPRVQANPEF
jgi:hypothetical protein